MTRIYQQNCSGENTKGKLLSSGLKGAHTRRFLGTMISSNEKSLVSTPRRSDEEDDEVEEKV